MVESMRTQTYDTRSWVPLDGGWGPDLVEETREIVDLSVFDERIAAVVGLRQAMAAHDGQEIVEQGYGDIGHMGE